MKYRLISAIANYCNNKTDENYQNMIKTVQSVAIYYHVILSRRSRRPVNLDTNFDNFIIEITENKQGFNTILINLYDYIKSLPTIRR